MCYFSLLFQNRLRITIPTYLIEFAISAIVNLHQHLFSSWCFLLCHCSSPWRSARISFGCQLTVDGRSGRRSLESSLPPGVHLPGPWRTYPRGVDDRYGFNVVKFVQAGELSMTTTTTTTCNANRNPIEGGRCGIR